MKGILSISFIVACSLSFAGPKSAKISLSPVTQNYFGTTIDAGYKFYYPKSKYYLGLGFLVNPPVKGVKPNALFTNKAYATNFYEHLAFKCGHEFNILSRHNDKARIFYFTELVVASTGLKVEDYFHALGNDSYNEDTFFVYETNYVETTTKATFINVNLGFGFEVPVTNRFSIQGRGGVSPGIVLYKFLPTDANRTWGTSISHMFYSFSINYEFKK